MTYRSVKTRCILYTAQEDSYWKCYGKCKNYVLHGIQNLQNHLLRKLQNHLLRNLQNHLLRYHYDIANTQSLLT
jgi:hypothetical protein